MNAIVERAEAVPAVRQVSVNGYIDAMTNNRVYGWAWDAQNPTARITIRLQAKGNAVGMIEADLPREDLKASGIGDGGHAFEVAIPEGISPNDISLWAVCPDTGQSVELSPRGIAGRSESNGGPDLRSAVETLTKSHGFIHRKLQTIAASLEESRRNGVMESLNAASEEPDTTDYASLERLQTLEDAMLRLDNIMMQQTTAIESLHDQPTDNLSRLLAGAALVFSVSTLLIVLLQ